MHNPLTLHISLAVLLLAVFAFQFEVLQPIEKALLGKGQIHFADWLFLPHGLRVIFVVLLGASVLWSVFPVQLAAMCSFCAPHLRPLWFMPLLLMVGFGSV